MIEFRYYRDRLEPVPSRFFNLPEDCSLADVQNRLAFPNRLTENEQLRQWARADWQYVDHRLMQWTALFLEELRKRGCPFYVHSAYRTREQQEEVFNAGHSKVQWPKAAHCQGKAVDIVHGIYHWDLTPNEWLWLGAIGRQVHNKLMSDTPKAGRWALVWGGSWNGGKGPKVVGWDPAHWEMADWRENIQRFQTGPKIEHTPRAMLRYFYPKA